MKAVIHTEATGFIGRWLVQNLLDAGVDVTIIVRDKSRIKADWADRVHIYESEYYNYENLQIPEREYDAFYHLAWDGVASEK